MLGCIATPAAALTLGGITIQSTLGEALQAEVDLPNITPAEAISFRANAASPAAYAAVGLEYHPAFTGLQATLARRLDGSAYIRISTTRPIQEPFVDLLLETHWASGRIVRDFTLLFDLPAPKDGAAPAPTLPQTAASPASPTAGSKANVAAGAGASQAQTTGSIALPKPATAPIPPNADAQQVRVKPGDSASKIALASQQSKGVSLDQLLVAMLRANPEAFTEGNLNRLRAGVLLNLPSAEQAESVDAAEAKRIVLAQSKDFHAYRRNLASNAPATPVESTSRSAQGSVQAQVESPKPAATAADKLTLSKGVAPAQADMSKLAQERNRAEAAQRNAELAKNIDALKKLSATAKTPGTAAAAQPASSASGGVLASTGSAPAAARSASRSAAVASAAKPEIKPDIKPEVKPDAAPTLLDQFLQAPGLLLGVGAVLLALLGGFVWYRRFQSQQAEYLDSSLQPDLFADDPAAQAETPPAVQTESPPSNLADLDLDLDLDFSNATALPANDGPRSDTAASSAAPTPVEHGVQEFDLDSISLDLNDTDADAKVRTAPKPANDMLEAQLALAEEFFLVGDHDGARSLLKEVLAEAQGTQHERAQRLLSKLV